MRIHVLLALLSWPACAADTTPFFRMGDPFVLPATATAQQYQINQPAGSTSYRFVNPCNVDVRIRTVGSLTEQVTRATGTRYLARTAEVVASSPPLTTPRIVSVMAMSDPGATPCEPELLYGSGQ